ncbi:putative NADH dehydrogenase/NAD(P)H nitroreductase [Labrys miyagiensis]|uniref:Putative NADH dehydrogenase/NAD(P)H nitroreductase GCM10007874_56350 n=1 Tax=Labrys miyagiensis TaxID=346912 RepID=A0ABQ6CUF0_9HYPH|nr:malonic semialdehyde reductase [Labrys miyagiensis]GLS22615.1 putative NADH dehydrogenase/NAD(P)H nitroreductase [Labrys miyagiensis]
MRNEAIEGGAAGSAIKGRVDAAVLDQLFYKARTHNAFLDRHVPDALLKEAVDITVQGPTSANQLPLRVVFVRSPEAKARLKDALAPGNVDKTMAAPVTAILAYDLKFFEHLPRLFPHADAKSWFSGNEAFAKVSAHTNGTLQAAYFILALRSLGLDAGPMTGFDSAKLDAEFFPDGQFKSNILVNIGYGDDEKLFPRSPRFQPEEIVTFA